MAMVEEFEKSGNWLFRWRSFLPLVLYVMALIVMLFGWDDQMDHRDLTWILVCLGVSFLGLIVRAFTVGYTPKGTSGRNTAEGQVAEVLNTKGIYSMVRHPLYLGNFFMWVGIIMYVGNWWFTALCTLMFWLYYERIMFAEEAFLTRKFGSSYKKWAEKTPPFLPRFSNYEAAGMMFSMKNVLKREYNGFFAVFISFLFLDIIKNYLDFERFELDFLIDPFWMYTVPVSFIIFITLRTLKKKTSVLDVKGREYEK
ncbi:methyltransferase family protein [Sanyastnella coralliicola]|uniref:methyltransferase family protein n=1 Tax=Sanyastnella coralliicola TaxID=3069118 RepID=UPI0027B988BA|nr:isoprenylcysteine carboxylmethyltransferase family protein [Longitalea sp. SCSIO 12813]